MTKMRLKSKDGKFFVGSVGVDSGQIFITDPAYIKHHEALYNPEKWRDFVMERHPIGINEPAKPMMSGICTSTNFGDGEYPVYVTLDADGSPEKIEVIFTRMTTDKDESNKLEYEDVEN